MSGVPVAVAAKVYGKDPAWVRAGIVCGWLPIGIATRRGQQVTRLEVKLKEETGFEWKGAKILDRGTIFDN